MQSESTPFHEPRGFFPSPSLKTDALVQASTSNSRSLPGRLESERAHALPWPSHAVDCVFIVSCRGTRSCVCERMHAVSGLRYGKPENLIELPGALDMSVRHGLDVSRRCHFLVFRAASFSLLITLLAEASGVARSPRPPRAMRRCPCVSEAASNNVSDTQAGGEPRVARMDGRSSMNFRSHVVLRELFNTKPLQCLYRLAVASCRKEVQQVQVDRNVALCSFKGVPKPGWDRIS